MRQSTLKQETNKGGHRDILAFPGVPLLPCLYFSSLVPCEPLIPLMSFGAGNTEVLSSILVLLAFCGTTVLTMLSLRDVLLLRDLPVLPVFMKFEDYMHAATGLHPFSLRFRDPVPRCVRLNEEYLIPSSRRVVETQNSLDILNAYHARGAYNSRGRRLNY